MLRSVFGVNQRGRAMGVLASLVLGGSAAAQSSAVTPGEPARFLAKHPDGGVVIKQEDREALAAFLESLTDESFLKK